MRTILISENNIIPKILAKIEEEAEQEEANRPHALGVYRASEVGSCPRAIQYSRLNTEAEKLGPEVQLIFRDGHLHHGAVRELLSKVGTLSSVERTISKKYTHKGQKFLITGTVDGIWNGVVFDIKSMNTFRFKTLDKDFENSFKSYIWQLTIYMDILGKKRGVLIFKDKNSGELRTVELKYNEFLMSRILDAIADIHSGIKKKQLIDRPYERNNWICKNCQYRLVCWNLPMQSRAWSPVKREGVKDALGTTIGGQLRESLKVARKARQKRSSEV